MKTRRRFLKRMIGGVLGSLGIAGAVKAKPGLPLTEDYLRGACDAQIAVVKQEIVTKQSRLIGCHIKPRTDQIGPMFTEHSNGFVSVNLVGYAIVPVEEYNGDTYKTTPK